MKKMTARRFLKDSNGYQHFENEIGKAQYAKIFMMWLF